jgi:hypothetical protein
MYPRSVHAFQADALFASALQRSDELSVSQIQRAIAAALDGYGVTGCAGQVAQEFGDHPETAAVRMRWARAAVAALEGHSPGPPLRRIAAAA